MGTLFNFLWNKGKNYSELASRNRKAIAEYNERLLSAITLIGGFLLLLPAFTLYFSNVEKDILVYLIISFFTLYAMRFFTDVFREKVFSYHAIYLFFSSFYPYHLSQRRYLSPHASDGFAGSFLYYAPFAA
jgi:membrane-associated HD superfamily phosphohydrolase